MEGTIGTAAMIWGRKSNYCLKVLISSTGKVNIMYLT